MIVGFAEDIDEEDMITLQKAARQGEGTVTEVVVEDDAVWIGVQYPFRQDVIVVQEIIDEREAKSRGDREYLFNIEKGEEERRAREARQQRQRDLYEQMFYGRSRNGRGSYTPFTFNFAGNEWFG